MNLYALPNLACAIACAGIGLFALAKNRRSPVNVAFSLLALSAFIWQLGTFFLLISKDPSTAYRWSRFVYVGAIFIPVTTYHFVAVFLKETTLRRKVLISYLLGALVFLPLSQTRYFLDGVHEYPWGYWFKAGLLHPAFLVFFAVLMVMSLGHLYRSFHQEIPKSERTRRRYLLIAFLGAYIGSVDFPSDYGIQIYPFGYLPVLVFIALVAYAIVRYRLMDINLAVTRTAVFSGVYAFVLGLPLLAALAWQLQLERALGTRWWVLLWFVCAVLATAAHYANLHFQRQAEERLLFEERKAHEALREVSQNMMRFTRLKPLLGVSVKQLVHVLQVPHAAIYLLDEEKKLYERKGARHSPPRALKDSPLPGSIPAGSTLIKDLEAVGLPRVREELRLQQQAISARWHEMAADMEKLHASVVIPAFRRDKMFGFVLLGDKKSGRIWSQDDLNVLTVLANQAALAVENAQLHEAEEQRLIKEAIEQTAADISYGVSHQFNNRLYVIAIMASSPVASLMGKDLDNLPPEEARKWLKKMFQELKKISDEAEMGGQISKGIMSLAKAIPENFKPIEVPPLIDQAVNFVKIKHTKEKVEGEQLSARILNGVPKKLSPILGNSAQVHDSIMNILDNALDAIREKVYKIRRGMLPAPEQPYEGKIRVQAAEKDGWIVVTIEDNGIGVKQEDMRKIFAPYFTTKATGTKGKGLGGHGLGLYFIKKILEAHGGKVSAESEYLQWTRFTVELPAAKPEALSHAA